MSTRGSDLAETARTVLPLGPDAGSFPSLSRTYLAYRLGAPQYDVRLRRLKDGTERSLGKGYGNNPVVVDGAFVAWQAGPDYALVMQTASLGTQIPVIPQLGRPTGLSRIDDVDFTVILIDDDRIYNGYTRPSFAPGAVAVENHTTGNLIFRADGKQALAFDGEEAFTPSLAFDGGTNYLIGTWGTAGVRIALVTSADFGDAPSAPPPPIIPPSLPPVPPPLTPPHTMTPQDLANVLKIFPQDVFLDHYYAYQKQLLDRDRLGDEAMDAGAVMLFFGPFFGACADAIISRGIPTGAPVDVATKWNAIADSGLQAAISSYNHAVGR